jgi:lipid-binding SYLF domain-containing protein
MKFVQQRTPAKSLLTTVIASISSRALTAAKQIALLICVFACASPGFAAEEADRVAKAGQALQEILATSAIPQNLLDHAVCVIVLPSVKKGAFGVGGTYGRGVTLCRTGPHFSGPWGPPALYALEGLTVKFPGGRDTDFLLLVMDPAAARALLSNRTKLGTDLTVAAGYTAQPPEAAVEATMNAQVLSYSRNGGAFAGISLAGSTLRSDTNADQKYYGKRLTATQILAGREVPLPSSAKLLVSLLNSQSPTRPSSNP